MKAAAQWLRSTVFREEAIRPRPASPAERIPSMLRAARSLETGIHQGWQSREALFLKQAKLLAGYEDDHDYHGSVLCYYPTYQSLTDQQLRGYFSWRTKLRRGDVREAPLSFAFLYIYELINQVGVADPMDGYRKLTAFRDAYGPINGRILPYLDRWLTDHVVYYGLDPGLLSGTPQAARDRAIAVLEQIREGDDAGIMDAVRTLSSWLERSKFYAECRQDMDAVTVRVLRRMSGHYAARCKKTLAEQYFGCFGREPVDLFSAAVFCDPLKRDNYEYAAGGQCVYSCKNGLWSVWKRIAPKKPGAKLDALLKTVDSVMREGSGYRHPVKPQIDTKWILRLIREEAQGLLAEKRAAEGQKVTIDYGQLAQIRRDAAATREKLIVDGEADIPAQPAPGGAAQGQSALDGPPAAPDGDCPLSPAEYRLVQCLLYGGDTGWMQGEGHLPSVLADAINEKLYDTFLDTVIDDGPRLVEDYIDDLKEMVRP